MANQEGKPLADSNQRDGFQHIITAHLRRDNRGKEFLKFSTYLSFLQLTFRVYLPDLGKDKGTVLCSFSLKRPNENKDGSNREKTRLQENSED